jgi:hypothetical protein
MNLIQRVQDILLKPKDTWPVIDQEPGDIPTLYKSYVAILAAIPAVAKFLGFSMLGFGMFGWGIISAAIGYAISLGLVFVLAWIANELAPTFGGTKNLVSAFKLVAYSFTATFVGGVFYLIPALSVLALVASLYSIYLLYTGVSVMMKSPEDKAPAYTAIIFVCGLVASLLLGAVFVGSMPMMYRAH